jgi:hypothetical protein
VSGPRHDCAAVDAALDELFRNLANLSDKQDERPEGVGDRERGLAYLAQIAPEAIYTQDVEALLKQVRPRMTELFFRKAEVNALALLAVVQAIGGLETTAAGLCVSCGLGSARRYCDACVRALAVQGHENPAHTGPDA